MGRPAQDITESELAVLRILWERETSTIRQLTDILYPRGEAAQYATVQKLLDRMESKGYVRRDRTMFVHIFRSVLDRDELIGRRLRSLAEMLCEGSLTPLLTHLARAKDLTEEDRLALRAIVDEPDPDADPSNIDLGNDTIVRSPGQSPPAASTRSSGNGRGNTGR
jgi:BlaI family penicillinase repressor